MSEFKRVKRAELQRDLAVVWVGDDKQRFSPDRASLRKELDELYETYNFQKLILNLKELTYSVNTDISDMLFMTKQLGRENMAVCCPSKMVAEYFRLTRMDRVWPIFATQQEAIDQFV